jgi:hypothetical protein
VSATDGRLNVPSINAIGYHHLWGVTRGATQVSPSVISDYTDDPISLPMMEEISVQLSDNAGAATNVLALLAIAPPNWSRNQPAGQTNLTVKASMTINTGAFSWSGLTPFVFETTLKGGWYSIVGLEVEGTNLLAYQVNFPRFPLVQGRKLYPGSFAIGAIGNLPPYYKRDYYGWWGSFHTVEPPQIQGMSAAGGNISCLAFVDLIYHGASPPPGVQALGIAAA